jgi:hypothetical protein
MVVGDLDVEIGEGLKIGDDLSLDRRRENETLEFARTASDDKGKRTSVGREVETEEEIAPREKVGFEAIREDADAIVAGMSALVTVIGSLLISEHSRPVQCPSSSRSLRSCLGVQQ